MHFRLLFYTSINVSIFSCRFKLLGILLRIQFRRSASHVEELLRIVDGITSALGGFRLDYNTPWPIPLWFVSTRRTPADLYSRRTFTEALLLVTMTPVIPLDVFQRSEGWRHIKVALGDFSRTPDVLLSQGLFSPQSWSPFALSLLLSSLSQSPLWQLLPLTTSNELSQVAIYLRHLRMLRKTSYSYGPLTMQWISTSGKGRHLFPLLDYWGIPVGSWTPPSEHLIYT